MTDATKVADEIINTFVTKGNSSYAGEAITQIEHAGQTALFAKKDSNDDEVILAAFLHDIGHLIEEDGMDGFGVKNHEEIGAAYLQSKGFSDKIIALVKSHVATKRYLCFANKEYYNQLSEASKTTLVFQGGIMTREEAITFEENPLKNVMIKLRTWDEKAKVQNQTLPNLSDYHSRIITNLKDKIN